MMRRAKKFNVADIKASQPFERELKRTQASGVTITYGDQDGFSRTCVIYLVHSSKFGCSCTLECFDPDKHDAESLVQKTLESLRPK